MRWLDTNIFLRFLTNDDRAKAAACLALFQQVQRGDEWLTTSESIVAEVTFVLTRQYHLSHSEITARLRPVLSLSGLRISEKHTVLRALEYFGESERLDFEDALSVAHMERLGISEIVSYDRDFDRVSGIVRQEP
ncbi:MAG TPA: PIN domain-containing protein [Thermomicrobiaceae bacterium]|nr:PIN domain-containing protein [Thermomicrobiaceae bacterium]